jgi:hypothetical protein
MVKQIFEESYIVCSFDDSVPVLSHRWVTHTNAENLCNALIRMADIFKELKLQYPNLTWLGDTTNLGVLSLETQAWLSDFWIPYMLEAGIRHHALVVAKDVFAKYAMNRFQDNVAAVSQEVEMHHFAEERLALEWLRKRALHEAHA